MYKIKFVRYDANVISFDNVTSINYGKELRELSHIKDQAVLTNYFSPNGFYQLVTADSNICYHDLNTGCVEITKSED